MDAVEVRVAFGTRGRGRVIRETSGSTTTIRQEGLANSADVAILLFCLSAIGPHPSPSLSRAAKHAIDMLRPGGTLVIRDYGRLDEGTNEVCVFFLR